MIDVMKKFGMAAAVAMIVAATPAVSMAEDAAPADSAPLSASLDLPVLSAYVWRGQLLNEDAVLQPGFSIEKNGFGVAWWGSMNLTDEQTEDAAEFTEHDITVSYSFSCPVTKADISLGVVNYDFPNVGIVDAGGNATLVNDTREAFATFGWSCPANPTLAVYYDFKEADGFYGSLSVGHSQPIGDLASVDLSASIGVSSSDWNEYYYGTDDEALNDWSASVAVPFQACDSLTITPAIQYAALIDSDITDTVEETGLYYGETDQWIASLKASYGF